MVLLLGLWHPDSPHTWSMAVAQGGPHGAFWLRWQQRSCRGVAVRRVPAGPLIKEPGACWQHAFPCRKAIEGLVALSEDGCSPISIQQMAYGECRADARGTGGVWEVPGAGGSWVWGVTASLSRQWLAWASG